MTKYARRVLDSAKLAADEIKKEDFDSPKWILRFFCVMALLRAVGHVSYNIDLKQKPNIQIKNLWEEKLEEEIFKYFIENERNMILKEFDFERVTKEYSLRITDDGSLRVTNDGRSRITDGVIYFKNTEKNFPVISKPLYELIDDSVVWWSTYLNELDKLKRV